MIEATVLRYFREVARAGSLTAAAETLGVATSALSRQMRMLEDHYGTRLFHRKARGMHLNPAGVVLLEFLTKQSQDADDFRTRFDEYLNVPRGRVRLVTIEGALPQLVAEFALRFQQRHALIKLSVDVVGSNTAADMVAAHEADLGLLFGPAPRGDLIELALMHQPLCLIVAKHHPLAMRPVCAMHDMVGHSVVLPDSTFGIRQEIDRATALARIQLDIAMETNSIALMRQLAVGGACATFLPQSAAFNEIQSGSLVAIPLHEKRLSTTKLSLVRSASRPLTPSAHKAVDLIRQHMALERSTSAVTASTPAGSVNSPGSVKNPA